MTDEVLSKKIQSKLDEDKKDPSTDEVKDAALLLAQRLERVEIENEALSKLGQNMLQEILQLYLHLSKKKRKTIAQPCTNLFKQTEFALCFRENNANIEYVSGIEAAINNLKTQIQINQRRHRWKLAFSVGTLSALVGIKVFIFKNKIWSLKGLPSLAFLLIAPVVITVILAAQIFKWLGTGKLYTAINKSLPIFMEQFTLELRNDSFRLKLQTDSFISGLTVHSRSNSVSHLPNGHSRSNSFSQPLGQDRKMSASSSLTSIPDEESNVTRACVPDGKGGWTYVQVESSVSISGIPLSRNIGAWGEDIRKVGHFRGSSVSSSGTLVESEAKDGDSVPTLRNHYRANTTGNLMGIFGGPTRSRSFSVSGTQWPSHFTEKALNIKASDSDPANTPMPIGPLMS